MNDTPDKLYALSDGQKMMAKHFGPNVYFTGPVLEEGTWFATARSLKDGTLHKQPVRMADCLLNDPEDTRIQSGRFTLVAPLQDVAGRRIVANADRQMSLEGGFLWEVTLKDGTVGYYLPEAARSYSKGFAAFRDYYLAHPPSRLPVPETYPVRLHELLAYLEKRMLELHGSSDGYFSYTGFSAHADGTLVAFWTLGETSQSGFHTVPAVIVAEAEELFTPPV